MASTNNVNQTTPTIDRLDGLFLKQVISTKIFQLGEIQRMRTVRNKFAMNEFTADNMVQPYADEPGFTGSTNLGDAEFTTLDKSIRHKVPYSIFKNTQWKEAIENIAEEGLPAAFVDALASDTGEKVAAQVENEIVNGNGGLAGDPTGATVGNGWAKIIKDKLTAASLTSQIVTVTATADNPNTVAGVQPFLSAAVDQLPLALVNAREGVKIFMPPSIEKYLWRSYSQTQMTNIPQNDSLVFDRYPCEIIPNMNPNRVIIGFERNLGLGFPTQSGDDLSIDVLDQFKVNGLNIAIVAGKFGYGAGAVTTDWVVAEYDPA